MALDLEKSIKPTNVLIRLINYYLEPFKVDYYTIPKHYKDKYEWIRIFKRSNTLTKRYRR